jgi:hypothetical protein
MSNPQTQNPSAGQKKSPAVRLTNFSRRLPRRRPPHHRLSWCRRCLPRCHHRCLPRRRRQPHPLQPLSPSASTAAKSSSVASLLRTLFDPVVADKSSSTTPCTSMTLPTASATAGRPPSPAHLPAHCAPPWSSSFSESFSSLAGS